MLSVSDCGTMPAVWLQGGKTVCSFYCDEVLRKFIVTLWCARKPKPFFFQSSLCVILLLLHYAIQSAIQLQTLELGRSKRWATGLSTTFYWTAELPPVRCQTHTLCWHFMLHLQILGALVPHYATATKTRILLHVKVKYCLSSILAQKHIAEDDQLIFDLSKQNKQTTYRLWRGQVSHRWRFSGHKHIIFGMCVIIFLENRTVA